MLVPTLHEEATQKYRYGLKSAHQADGDRQANDSSLSNKQTHWSLSFKLSIFGG